jgi:hypothetical protein
VTEAAARTSGSGEHGSPYEISDRQMAAGSTLGAPKAVLTIKATGAIEKFYSVDAGKTVLSSAVLHHWDKRSGIQLSALPGTFIIHPHHQEHVFTLSNGISVREDVFILNGRPNKNSAEPSIAYYVVKLTNETDELLEIGTYASAQLRGDTEHDVCASYSKKHRALIAWNKSDPKLVRFFGCSVEPASYETTYDSGKSIAAKFPGLLCNKTLDEPGDPVGILHLSHRLEAGASAAFWCTFAVFTGGRALAGRAFASRPTAHEALERTRERYSDVLESAVVVTPDTQVNRGVLWAKANMLRTQSHSQTGWNFVNDPTRSNNSVGRDTAWFAFGADYVMPEFARESLLWYATHLEKSGMVIEYYDIRNGKSEDYGLNINDNTPLLILALLHHYSTTGDRAFLEEVYPYALKAARYMLSQRNDQGLVWCTATGVANFGIVGWRNVIENYRLSGASTEVNSECYAAFNAIAVMADAMEDPDQVAAFETHAKDLKEAINEHLLNPETGLYYLNIDLGGNPRTDVTSDLVFPVMFGVADSETSANIISRLSVAEFWTKSGIRTVPRNAIGYRPADGCGLLGGVWVGVSYWFAFAAAPFNPGLTAQALSTSFSHNAEDPLRYNTVPGQFYEWLNGETLVNHGMMLSPWFPPRYLWAAIEGLAGLDLSGALPDIKPRLPPQWKWLGVQNLRLAGEDVTWFVARTPELNLYGTFRFDPSMPYEAYDAEISSEISVSGQTACAIALRRGEDVTVFVGNTSDRTITTAVRVGCKLSGSYTTKVFNSLRGEWINDHLPDPAVLRDGLAVELDRKGFCVLEFRKEARA